MSLAALGAPAAAGASTWPVSGPVLQGFVFTPELPLAPGQHRGIDIQGPLGGQVLAPAAGTVTFTGTVAANGLTVTIQTADGYAVTLLHLGSSLVRRGMVVAEGQPVAVVGTSGLPEQPVPYVHLGLRLLADPDGYVDPQGFLPPLGDTAPGGTAPPPGPESQPVPVAPPAPATPPAATPPPPAAAVLRTAEPDSRAPARPVAQPDRVPALVTAPALPLLTPHAAPGAPAAMPTEAPLPSLELHPSDLELERMPATSQTAPARQLPTHPVRSWLRTADPFAAPAGHTAARAQGAGFALPLPALLALLAAVTATLSLCGRRIRRKAARIIDGDALLPDHADLLREREPAHRARVHDHRRRRARTAPQAAR